MDFSVGDHVRLVNGRTGRIARINGQGRFDVNLDESATEMAERGHAALRSNVNQPSSPQDVAVNVPASDLAKLPRA